MASPARSRLHDQEDRATAKSPADTGPTETADHRACLALSVSPLLLRSIRYRAAQMKHQFQFAGYYQALTGLLPDARSRRCTIHAKAVRHRRRRKRVGGGKADYGVCTSSVLRDWAAGRPN